MSAQEIYDDLQGKIARMEEICATAKKEGRKDNLIEAEKKEFDAVMAKAIELKSKLSKALKSDEQLRNLVE